MNSVAVLTQNDFLDGITVDTRIDLKIINITDKTAVQKKLLEVCGTSGADCEGGLFITGNSSLIKDRYGFGDLLHIMARLTREDGCPWDKAQTHESIRINAIEEAYELAAAIDNNDLENMTEEVGDLLLQSVFHADIAERSGEFTLIDVIDSLCKKLVLRHTHIFGDTKASNPDEALAAWEAAKAKEKTKRGLKESLSDLSKSMPALLYAEKAIKKLVKNGLVNEASSIDAKALLSVAAGAAVAGIDGEAELRKETDKLVEGFFDGRIKTVK